MRERDTWRKGQTKVGVEEDLEKGTNTQSGRETQQKGQRPGEWTETQIKRFKVMA